MPKKQPKTPKKVPSLSLPFCSNDIPLLPSHCGTVPCTAVATIAPLQHVSRGLARTGDGHNHRQGATFARADLLLLFFSVLHYFFFFSSSFFRGNDLTGFFDTSETVSALASIVLDRHTHSPLRHFVRRGGGLEKTRRSTHTHITGTAHFLRRFVCYWFMGL